MLRPAACFQRIEAGTNRHRSVELMTRGMLGIKLVWSDPKMKGNNARLKELIDQG